MKRYSLILIVLLLVASLACNITGQKAAQEPAATSTTAEAQETPAPSGATTGGGQGAASTDAAQGPASPGAGAGDTSTETGEEPAAGETEESAAASEVGLEGINSYRGRHVWHAEYGDGTVEEVLTEDEMVREPFAYHSLMHITAGGQVEEMETIHIGSDHWLRLGDEWVQTQSDELNFEDNQTIFYFMDYAPLIEHGDYQSEGRETVNGIKTRHYRSEAFTGAEMEQAWVQAMLSGYNVKQGITAIENVLDEVWIADEPDLPAFAVRRVQEAKATDPDGQTVKYTSTSEVYDLNEPITIEPPAEAAGGWPPDDVPVCPDGSVSTSMGMAGGGILMIACQGAMDDVADYYREQLPAAGWTQTETNELAGTMITETWTKESRTLSLMISPGDGGGTSVTITVGAE